MPSKDSYTIHSEHKELQSLRSRQHSKDIATKPLQFHILRAHGPGTFNFGPVVGTRGTVDCAVEAGDPGSLQSIFEIEGIARAKLDQDNRVFVELLNSDGSVAMHSDPVCPVYSPPVPPGYLLRFRLAWDSEGNLPESMRTNSPIAHLNVNGTWAGWIVSKTWDPTPAKSIKLGSDFAGGEFDGTVRLFSYGPVVVPDTETTAPDFSDVDKSPAPIIVSVQIEHLGKIVIEGAAFLSSGSVSNGVEISGNMDLVFTRNQILSGGGVFVDNRIEISAHMVEGADATTECVVAANLKRSAKVACSMPDDAPWVLLISIDGNMSIYGSNFESRYPYSGHVEITGAGAVVLTQDDVLGAGGQWTDDFILIPSSLIPGVDGSSICRVSSNSRWSETVPVGSDGFVTDWANPDNFTYFTQPVLSDFSGIGWIGSGLGPYKHDTGQTAGLSLASQLIVDNVYEVKFKISGASAGTITPKAGTSAGLVQNSNGEFSDIVECKGNTTVSFQPSTDFNGSLSIMSVKNLSIVEALTENSSGIWEGAKFVQNSASNMPYFESGGVKFDGTYDYLELDKPSAPLHSDSGFTAAFVVEPEIAITTGNGTILDEPDGDPNNHGIQVVYDPDNQQLSTNVANGSGTWAASGSTWLSRGIPHTVDMTWSTANGLKLNVDDHYADSASIGVGSNDPATNSLQLGRRVSGDNFGGKINDLVVRTGEVPEKSLEQWRQKMRTKHTFKGKTYLNGFEFATPGSKTVTVQLVTQPGDTYIIDWGDGFVIEYVGKGKHGDNNKRHTYLNVGRWHIRIYMNNPYSVNTIDMYGNLLTGQIPNLGAYANLQYVDLANNQLTGQIPDLSTYTNLRYVEVQQNRLTGSIPDLSALINLDGFTCGNNQLTGSFPDFNSGILDFSCESNQLTGQIPDLSVYNSLGYVEANNNEFTGSIPNLPIDMQAIYLHDNKLTGYDSNLASVVDIQELNLSNNLLTESAVDQVIADIHGNLNDRIDWGILYLGGTGNSAPSAEGVSKAQDIRNYGWDINHN